MSGAIDLDAIVKLPCPFCGGVGHLRNAPPHQFYIWCGGCEAEMAVRTSMVAAWQAWNQRAHIAPLDVVNEREQEGGGE